MAFQMTAEKSGWSAAPEINDELARQKATCDELVARIRAGTLQNNFSYAFGKVESLWRFVEASAQNAHKETQITETTGLRESLFSKILEYNNLSNFREPIPLFEQERRKKLLRLNGEIIDLFDRFYGKTLQIGVAISLFSLRKGGDWKPDKQTRGAGLPVFGDG